MYIIFAYDIASPKRLIKVLKKSRAYLYRVQNSVFEGNLTKAQFRDFKNEIIKLINEEEDSLLFYTSLSERSLKRECYGIKKGQRKNII